MPRELPKNYDPGSFEASLYQRWNDAGCFAPSSDRSAVPYSITIPPPNVTGELHLGHALQHTIHDVIIRRRRMQGASTLCLPGTDHAGISTNVKVDQALRAEGTDRWTAGRERFVDRAREWTLQYGGAILHQLRTLGCSYDWGRTRFTLDEFVESGPETAEWALGRLYTSSGYARAVFTAFVRFWERGWIYRAERIVNWCPHCRTTLSELELDHRELEAALWQIRYPDADGGPGLVVATTRPETLLGDTGVAVAAGDDRYSHLVGRKVILPLLNREIPVVADHHVDRDFGTGAVKVTPAHDPNDWEIAARHPELLPPLSVIDDRGWMTELAGPFAGQSREQARKAVLAALIEENLLVAREDYRHSVAHHDKCGAVVEPLLKLQWWARCDDMAARAISAIDAGRIAFTPGRFTQMEMEWLANIRPWCISRQLWWGHRIPLYYCTACDKGIGFVEAPSGEKLLEVSPEAQPVASVTPPESCPRCGAGELVQDPDVLDTWFSSALWPHATLGWPEESPDLARFYPTDLMITGRDILYLWVARMIMTGLEFTGEVPFRRVLLHATVLSEDGRRMSKSLGTGVDPLELIRLYGADATRLGLASLVSESQDIRFKMTWTSGGKAAAGPDDRLARAEQIEQMRNFCTKLWNVSRFVLMNLPSDGPAPRTPEEILRERRDELELADRWILSRLSDTSHAVNEAVEAYAIGEAAWLLYHFVWDEFADWYIELVKPRLRGDGAPLAHALLGSVLDTLLRLAHPFIPFLTEEIWQALPGRLNGEWLMNQPYPGSLESARDEKSEQEMAATMELVRAIRNLKAELGIATRSIEVHLDGEPARPDYVERSARVSIIPDRPQGLAGGGTAGGINFVAALEGVLDAGAETARIEKEMAAARSEIEALDKRLGNPQFRERAPAEVVEKQQQARTEALARLKSAQDRLRLFQS